MIPLLFGPTELPGFLKDRHWINFQDGEYQRNVDMLVRPGIIGRQVAFASVPPCLGFAWGDLGEYLSRFGCKVWEAEDIDRAPYRIPRHVAGRTI